MMRVACEVEEGRTDGDRWGTSLIHSLEVFIETYIDNRSFFFLWSSILIIRAIPSVTSKMHYNDRYPLSYTKRKY